MLLINTTKSNKNSMTFKKWKCYICYFFHPDDRLLLTHSKQSCNKSLPFSSPQFSSEYLAIAVKLRTPLVFVIKCMIVGH